VRCKHCDYPLWNIKARLCPECGAPFQPSDFEFIANTVRYLCPHCNQDYYGTDEKGHLEPAQFDCVRCGNHVHMDEMTLLPTAGVQESQTEPEVMAWRERARIGLAKAWFFTIFKAMFTPPLLMRADPGPSVLSAWWFMILTQLVFAGVCVLGVVLYMALMFGLVAASGGPGTGGVGVAMVATILGMVIGALFSYLIGVALWGAVSHWILLATGGTQRSIGSTYQAICYASGANVLTALPCAGFQLAPLAVIWWIVSAILMVAERQRVSGLRATFAVGAPPVVIIVVIIGAIAAMLFSSISAAQTAMAQASAQAAVQSNSSISTAVQAIIDHAAEAGAEPVHGLALVGEGRLSPSDLYPGYATMTNPTNIPVGDATLSDFQAASAPNQEWYVQTAAEELTPNVIAHRLGDLVFTYHGIDLSDPDPGLWLVIHWRDPFLNNQQGFNFPEATYAVGLADGSVTTIDVTDFQGALQAQNELRATYGLAPLPRPNVVTHVKPAVGGGG